jgi:hypothetical protein
MKIYACEVLSAAFLVGVIEAYFWTQSRTPEFENSSTKLLIVSTYVAVACISEFAVSFWLRPKMWNALKANALVAALISLGAAALVSSVHPGVIKDAYTGATSFFSTTVKFLVTIGLATGVLRMMVAGLVLRAASVKPVPHC